MKKKTKRRMPPNPKDIYGSVKAPMSLVPAVATTWEAAAFADGASKYGAYNWRENAVQAKIYVDAAKRHLDLWLEGQRLARDSKVHHLAHSRACLGILIDAEAYGNLIDNRPPAADVALMSVQDEVEALLTAKRKAKHR